MSLCGKSTAVTNPLAEDFWQFSLSLYAQRGVSDACLLLQDNAGVNVNVLLFVCFLKARDLPLDRASLGHLIAAIANSDKQITAHRKVRIAAKPDEGEHCEHYERLKAEELALERKQQYNLIAEYGRLSPHDSDKYEAFLDIYTLDTSVKSSFYFIIQQF